MPGKNGDRGVSARSRGRNQWPSHATKRKTSRAARNQTTFLPMKVALPRYGDREISKVVKSCRKRADVDKKATSSSNFVVEKKRRANSTMSITERPYPRLYGEKRPNSSHGIDREPPKNCLTYQKHQEVRHIVIKQEAKELWMRLGRPHADCPIDPDQCIPPEAIEVAKRGKQCASESDV